MDCLFKIGLAVFCLGNDERIKVHGCNPNLIPVNIYRISGKISLSLGIVKQKAPKDSRPASIGQKLLVAALPGKFHYSTS